MLMDAFEKMIKNIFKISKETGIKKLSILDEKYFPKENTASMIIESYFAELNYYSNFDNIFFYDMIKFIENLLAKIDMEKEEILIYTSEIGNAYFNLGQEEKARKIEFDLIDKFPDLDDPYQIMCNWYMYYVKNIEKLEEVVLLAAKNKHILFTDFAMHKLLEYYKTINNKEKQEYYTKLINEYNNQ